MRLDSGLFEEILGLLSRSDPIDATLDPVLDRALRLVGLEKGAIFLIDLDRKVLLRRADRGLTEPIQGALREIPFGESVVGKVAQTGKRLSVPDFGKTDRLGGPFAPEEGIKTFVCVPIRSRGSVLGVLSAGSARSETIREHHLSMLSAVAQQIGVAVDNAQLLIRSRESERLCRHLLDHAPDLNILCDPQLQVLRMNTQGLSFFSLSQDQVRSTGLQRLIGEKAFRPFLKMKETLVRGAPGGANFEITLEDCRGKKHFYEFQSTLIREEGDCFFLYFVGRDLTKRKELESRLLEYADRLEEMVERRAGQLQEAKNQIAYLFNVSTQIQGLESVDEKLRLIVHSIVAAGLYRKVVIRLDDRGGLAQQVAHEGFSAQELSGVEREVLALQALRGRVLAERFRIGNSYFVPAADEGDEDLPGAAQWREGDRLIIPLLGSDKGTIGYLVVDEPCNGLRPKKDLIQVLEILVNQAAQAVEGARLSRRLAEADRLRHELTKQYELGNLVGNTKEMRDVFDSVRKLAEVRSSVLITGESGTGKELVASAIHYNGPRRDGPFVKVNCAAIPESLLESELFGIEGKVATDVDLRIGKFEQADGGTLFLDEVADMSLATQAKVLRALQERAFERVGGKETIVVDVRILAASNRDLHKEMEESRFRGDLYYRLHVVSIHLPRLQDRRDDIPVLVDHLIEHCCREQNLPPKEISSEVLQLFHEYPWPGNVRQLRNCLERTLVMGRKGKAIELEDLPPSLLLWKSKNEAGDQTQEQLDLARSLESYEREIILDALRRAAWVQARAAKLLGISERAMWYRVKKLKIPIPA